MYFSQTAIVLVLLVFLTSTIFYQTVELKTNDVKNSMEIKKMSLYEKNLENTLDRVIDKIVEDAFVNRSYEIMHGDRDFYNSADEAVEDIESYIRNETNKSLYVLSDNNTISYSIGSIDIEPADNSSYVRIRYNVVITYSKKLKSGYVYASKPITMEKEVKLSRIPDPYVYRNNFYWEWHNYKDITVDDLVDGNYHTFCIILNNTNFDYTHMNNSNSPREIRIIGWNTTSNRWDVLLPYWVQTWRQGNNDVSIIWVNCSSNYLHNNNIRLLYNSSVSTDAQNPENTFILFDDFDYMDYDKWDVSGGCYINNSILTVQGLGSSVYTKEEYGTGYELMFKGNFSEENVTSVGFFTNKSNIGVGWRYQYEWAGNLLYFYNGYGWGNYIAGNDTIGDYFIYRMLRNDDSSMYGYIMYDNLTPIKTFDPTSGYYPDSSDTSQYPISINAIVNSDAKVSIDWIFLKDINDITTTVNNAEGNNPTYKELKTKTTTGTIYYGDLEQYVYVVDDTEAGKYSIIGLLTNATDSWGDCGYRPKIEIE
jgi:hypothetical protein